MFMMKKGPQLITKAPITTANVFAARISDARRKFLTLPFIMSAIWRA